MIVRTVSGQIDRHATYANICASLRQCEGAGDRETFHDTMVYILRARAELCGELFNGVTATTCDDAIIDAQHLFLKSSGLQDRSGRSIPAYRLLSTVDMKSPLKNRNFMASLGSQKSVYNAFEVINGTDKLDLPSPISPAKYGKQKRDDVVKKELSHIVAIGYLDKIIKARLKVGNLTNLSDMVKKAWSLTILYDRFNSDAHNATMMAEYDDWCAIASKTLPTNSSLTLTAKAKTRMLARLIIGVFANRSASNLRYELKGENQAVKHGFHPMSRTKNYTNISAADLMKGDVEDFSYQVGLVMSTSMVTDDEMLGSDFEHSFKKDIGRYVSNRRNQHSETDEAFDEIVKTISKRRKRWKHKKQKAEANLKRLTKNSSKRKKNKKRIDAEQKIVTKMAELGRFAEDLLNCSDYGSLADEVMK